MEWITSKYPADACGAICLSFRALGKLSAKIWPTHLEMTYGIMHDQIILPYNFLKVPKSDFIICFWLRRK
jgi:hypothetical protein